VFSGLLCSRDDIYTIPQVHQYLRVVLPKPAGAEIKVSLWPG